MYSRIRFITPIPIIVGALSFLFFQSVFGQTLLTSSQLYRKRIFQQALLLLPSRDVPAEYRDLVMRERPPKCGTFIISEARRLYNAFSPAEKKTLAALFERPVLDESYTKAGSRFRIHYSVSGADAVSNADVNSNSIPDYVEEVHAAFENSLDIETNVLGFRPPPDDQGIDGPEYDIYIQGLANGEYGLTFSENVIPETPQNDLTSYIKIDNDFQGSRYFTTGLDAARVTAAHELHHACQWAYRTTIFQNDNEFSYYELCASWMEDVVYDDVNDYFGSVPAYLGRTDLPLNMKSVPENYGAAIWNHFLVENYGDIDVVRRSWEEMASGRNVAAAIDAALEQRGIDLAEAFAEFAGWNYLPAEHYEEGAMFGEVRLRDDFVFAGDTTVMGSTRSLSYQYHRLITSRAGNYRFTGSKTSVDVPWRFVVILDNAGPDNPTFMLRPGQGLDLGPLPSLSQIVVAAVNIQALSGKDGNALSTSYVDYEFSITRSEPLQDESEGITAIYPNPYVLQSGSRITFEFSAVLTDRTEIRILTSGGRVLREEVYPASSAANAVSFDWDGKDSDGMLVASGIYIVELRQGNTIHFEKFAVVR